jgi:hypothetical protein
VVVEGENVRVRRGVDADAVRLCTGTYTPELELGVELDVDADEDEGDDATATDCEAWALAAATLMVMGIEGDISDRAELRAEEACESARRRRGREAE